jgi:hypothetical protein
MVAAIVAPVVAAIVGPMLGITVAPVVAAIVAAAVVGIVIAVGEVAVPVVGVVPTEPDVGLALPPQAPSNMLRANNKAIIKAIGFVLVCFMKLFSL